MTCVESLSDVVVVNIKSYKDDRGNFYKLFDDELKRYSKLKNPILEVNRSLTKKKGTIRGMHFQYPPFHETKLITCLKGSVKDIIVDIRQNSPTFLDYMSIKLDDVDNNMIVIPGGYAHGFQTLQDNCELLYFHDQIYSKKHEGALYYNDPTLGIDWDLACSEISERDSSHKLINSEFKGVMI